MTYLELANFICTKMTTEQMACDITIYDEMEDEYFPATLDFTGPDPDVLDPKHPYFKVLMEE